MPHTKNWSRKVVTLVVWASLFSLSDQRLSLTFGGKSSRIQTIIMSPEYWTPACTRKYGNGMLKVRRLFVSQFLYLSSSESGGWSRVAIQQLPLHVPNNTYLRRSFAAVSPTARLDLASLGQAEEKTYGKYRPTSIGLQVFTMPRARAHTHIYIYIYIYTYSSTSSYIRPLMSAFLHMFVPCVAHKRPIGYCSTHIYIHIICIICIICIYIYIHR